MKAEIVLECCSYKITTCSDNYHFVSCFKLKKGNKPFKTKFKDNKKIEKEIFFAGICPRCGHWILKFLWYSNKDDNAALYKEEKIVRGKKADEIFERIIKNYDSIFVPKVFRPEIIRTSDVPFGWVYGINKEIKNPKGEVVAIRQFKSDFLGQKQLIKETDLTTNIEKTFSLHI